MDRFLNFKYMLVGNFSALGFSMLQVKETLQITVLILTCILSIVKAIRDARK